MGKRLHGTPHRDALSTSHLSAAGLNPASHPRGGEQGLGSARYFPEHFKVSLHHLFFPNHNPAFLCSYSSKSEIPVESSRCGLARPLGSKLICSAATA